MDPAIAERLTEIFPPCAHCGKPYELTLFEAECLRKGSRAPEGYEYNFSDAWPYDPSEGPIQDVFGRRMIEYHEKGFGIFSGRALCVPCIHAAEKRTAEANRKLEIRQVVDVAYNTGLLHSETASRTFATSSPEIIAKNPHLWAADHTNERAGDITLRLPLQKNVWLRGKKGCGKTWLAQCVLNAYLDRGYSAAEVSAVQLNEWAWVGKWEQKIKPYCRADILLLDDLDVPTYREMTIDVLWYLLNARFERKLRTIITANGDPKAVEGVLGRLRPDNQSSVKAVLDRLRPMYRSIEMRGDSLRSIEQPHSACDAAFAPTPGTGQPETEKTPCGDPQAITEGREE